MTQLLRNKPLKKRTNQLIVVKLKYFVDLKMCDWLATRYICVLKLTPKMLWSPLMSPFSLMRIPDFWHTHVQWRLQHHWIGQYFQRQFHWHPSLFQKLQVYCQLGLGRLWNHKGSLLLLVQVLKKVQTRLAKTHYLFPVYKMLG